MRIGVDFDNTLVCFDPLFHSVALEKKLIPASVTAAKNAVRDFLRSKGREDDWTRLQATVYGMSIRHAKPYPGAIEFFKKAEATGHEIMIISHKTAKSALPPHVDLHTPARAWLSLNGISCDAFFEPAIDKKVARLRMLGCDVMIDDLIDFFNHPSFPPSVRRILFDPHKQYTGTQFERVGSWGQAAGQLLK